MWEIRETWTTRRTGTGEKFLSVISDFALDEIKFDCFPGTQGCTHKHIKITTQRWQQWRGALDSVIFLASPHQCWMSTLFSLLYLEEEGEWWGEQKHQTTKKVPNNTTIYVISTTVVSSSSSSSSSLSPFVLSSSHSRAFIEYHLALPLNPPL